MPATMSTTNTRWTVRYKGLALHVGVETAAAFCLPETIELDQRELFEAVVNHAIESVSRVKPTIPEGVTPDNITKERLAEMLNGREYGNEINEAEESLARKAGLVVVFGASDDLMEARGDIDEEYDCFEGGEFNLVRMKAGSLDCNAIFSRKEMLEDGFDPKEWPYIKAVWAKDGYSWTYETDIPHATFDILEDGEKYCRGIVFSVNNLKS